MKKFVIQFCSISMLVSMFIGFKILLQTESSATQKRKIASTQIEINCINIISNFLHARASGASPRPARTLSQPYYRVFEIQSALNSEEGGKYVNNFTMYQFRSAKRGRDLDVNWKTDNIFSVMGLEDKRLVPDVKGQDAFDELEKTLRDLYNSYASQGNERKNFIEEYLREDTETSHRTTHFMLIANDEPIMHIQAQHSNGPNEPLNLEKHFGQQVTSLRDDPNQLAVEIGRFTVLTQDKVVNEKNKALLKSKIGRNQVMLETWMQMTSWLLKEARPVVTEFQVNGPVLAMAERLFAPFKIKVKKPVRMAEDLPWEYVVKFSLEDIKEIRQIILKKKMLSELSNFLKSDEKIYTTVINEHESDLFKDLRLTDIMVRKMKREFETNFRNAFPRNTGGGMTISYGASTFNAPINALRFTREEAKEALRLLQF